MALVGKQWTKVSLHKVVLAWLRGERGKPNAMAPAGLLDSADLSSSDENRARLRFFYILRGPYFIELPPDTEWHEVQSLTDAELSELYAVNHPDWMVAGRATSSPESRQERNWYLAASRRVGNRPSSGGMIKVDRLRFLRGTIG
jgi:hypothetical protein